MQAHRPIVTVFSLGATLILGTPAMSADLPKEGSNSLSIDVGVRCQIAKSRDEFSLVAFTVCGGGTEATRHDRRAALNL
jgi:hypothetical protein